jgi:hypothetical protein
VFNEVPAIRVGQAAAAVSNNVRHRHIRSRRSQAMTARPLAFLGSTFGAILLMTSPHPAAAAIDELLVYPGSNCIRISGGTPSYTSSGRLVNNTASNITVQCPMYDNGFNFTGHVWVIDNSTTANITCSSVVRNPLGNPSTSQPKSTVGNASSAMTLSFDGPDAIGTFTYRFYNCVLPPTTQIISYRGRAV